MKKHKGKHGGHHHTGKISHADMTSLPHGMGGRDPHASAEHHAANKKHDMAEGMCPAGCYGGGAPKNTKAPTEAENEADEVD